eukprot:GGOE01015109.1.p1 GENE.GGOE01015109.1~~GGOE01015109.1.p1  ORF type:complete len:567 (-),score=79.53 GGOE01015109.1:147-1793(-)
MSKRSHAGATLPTNTPHQPVTTGNRAKQARMPFSARCSSAAPSSTRPQHGLLPPLQRGSLPQGYETWDDVHVKLPCASRNVDNHSGGAPSSRWETIMAVMNRTLGTTAEVIEAILAINPFYSGVWDLGGLRDFLDHHLTAIEHETFFCGAIPNMQKLVKQMPCLFPDPLPLLTRGCQRTVTLTNQQVACLLANAFFCTFPHRNRKWKFSEYGNFPSINFSNLFRGQRGAVEGVADSIGCSPQQAAKFRCFLAYMQRVLTEPVRHISFSRHVLGRPPQWEQSTKPLCKLRCIQEGCIEDHDPQAVHVDFANRWLGGGVLGRGCVQEEILFAICPELIASRLFAEALEDEEAVVFVGAHRFSTYTGYGDEFRYKGPYTESAGFAPNQVRDRVLVAIDALDFSAKSLTRERQYEQECVVRELNKAFCGFAAAHRDHHTTLATGHWGCGAFRGDRQLKAIIQLLAASEAGYESVAFYSPGDEEFSRALTNTHALLVDADVRVGQVYDMLTTLSLGRAVANPFISPLSHIQSFVAHWAPRTQPALQPEPNLFS